MWYYIPDKHGNPKAVTQQEYIEFEQRNFAKRGTEDDPWIVARTTVDDVLISTVMLMIDHDMLFHLDQVNPHPLVYETMIFGGPRDSYQRRYRSLYAAKLGHDHAVALVQADSVGLKVVNE